MTTPFAHIRTLAGVVACLLLLLLAAPAGAQQPTSVNPTASAVNEQKLLQQLDRIQGRISIPDNRAGTLEQPAGRDWRHFHEVTLRWIGVISIVGMLAILVV